MRTININVTQEMKRSEASRSFEKNMKRLGATLSVLGLIWAVIISLRTNVVYASHYTQGSETLEGIEWGPMVQQPTDFQIEAIELNFNNASYETKRKNIADRLKYNNVPDSDIGTFIAVFELESCRNHNDPGCFN